MERPISNGSTSPDNLHHSRSLSGNSNSNTTNAPPRPPNASGSGSVPGSGSGGPNALNGGSTRTGTDPRDPRSFPAHQIIVDHPMPMRIPDESNVTELKPPRPPSTTPSSPRKRKKLSDGDPEPVRRLRRNHEACSRCRHKKIKVRVGRPP
jgi:hypothetical protein